MKRLKIILKFKYLFLIVFSFSIMYTTLYKRVSKYDINDNVFKGKVLSINEKEYKKEITIKAKEKLLVYYYGKKKIKINDYILVKGNLVKPNNNTNYNTFNYKKYLYNKKILFIIKSNDIKIINRNNNFIIKLRNSLNDRINTYKSKDYLKVFILGNKKDIDNNMIDIYKNIGVVHLLSISGTYISIIILFLNKIIKSNKRDNIISIFLIIYIFFTNFQISVIRSCLCYILICVNKKYKLGISSKSILLFVASLLLIINPYYIYDIGFILSFLISYSLIIYNYCYKDQKYFKKIIIISIISFFASLPIIINTSYSVNFLSIIYNIIYVPIVTFIMFPLSFITIVIHPLDSLFYNIIKILEHVTTALNSIKILSLSFSKIPILLVLLYYLLFFNNNKNKLLLLIIIMYLYGSFSFCYKVYYLDIGQGDSIIIRHKYKNIMIDTGGSISNDSSNHLNIYKSLGIKKIDLLIISHGDYDHMGEAINLVNNFKVEKVILNCGPYNDLEQELIKVLDQKHIKYYSCIKELNIDKNKLYFLQTKEYDNENDNSNVIYIEFDDYKFMFMGDASTTTEKEIIKEYNLTDIDVLKVGHHGSRTSSSREFINEINPKYSIISVGKNNRYGHPNKEVLEKLYNSKIYRTDQDGSIMFKIKNNKLKIETCSP